MKCLKKPEQKDMFLFDELNHEKFRKKVKMYYVKAIQHSMSIDEFVTILNLAQKVQEQGNDKLCKEDVLFKQEHIEAYRELQHSILKRKGTLR